MSDDWKEKKYKEVFDGLCRQARRRRQEDPNFSVDDLKAQLEHQYVYQGNDWEGRGALGDVTVSATVAAYEHLIAEWEGDRKPKHHSEIFRFDGEKYEKASPHQKEWGQQIIDDLNLQGHEHVLDLGCGDGVLTAVIAAKIPNGKVVGVDASESMIETAKKRSAPNLEFLLTDISDIDFQDQFDLVFSNAALHWVKAHRKLLARTYAALKPRGWIRFNFAAEGNCIHFFHIVREVMTESQFSAHFEDFEWPWFMPSITEYRRLVAQTDFDQVEIWGENRDRYFADQDEMVRWIDQPSLVPFLACLPDDLKSAFRDQVVEKMVFACRQSDGRCFETFRRINALAMKPAV